MRMQWLSLGLVVLFLSAVSTAPADEEEDRLLGGVNATSGDLEKFNFYVRLGKLNGPECDANSTLATLCQGILYNYDTIITVAHCAQFTQHLTHAVCGTEETQRLRISSVKLHPFFNSSSAGFLANDVAVVKLASKFTPSKYCKPAKLPSCPSDTFYNQNVTVLSFNTTGQPTLWYERNWVTVTLVVVPGQACFTSRYLGSGYNMYMHECLVDVEGSQTACQSDQGSAAVTADGTVLAIGSWLLKPCLQGNTSVPAAYVRLSKYVPWITYTALYT